MKEVRSPSVRRSGGGSLVVMLVGLPGETSALLHECLCELAEGETGVPLLPSRNHEVANAVSRALRPQLAPRYSGVGKR